MISFQLLNERENSTDPQILTERILQKSWFFHLVNLASLLNGPGTSHQAGREPLQPGDECLLVFCAQAPCRPPGSRSGRPRPPPPPWRRSDSGGSGCKR
jgi:hypothetical protein